MIKIRLEKYLSRVGFAGCRIFSKQIFSYLKDMKKSNPLKRKLQKDSKMRFFLRLNRKLVLLAPEIQNMIG